MALAVLSFSVPILHSFRHFVLWAIEQVASLWKDVDSIDKKDKHNDLLNGGGHVPNKVPQAVPSCPQSSRSATDYICFEHTWTVKRFGTLLNENLVGFPKFTSVLFSSPKKSDAKFQIELCPRGSNQENADFVSVYLLKNAHAQDEESDTVMFKLSILDVRGEKHNSKVSLVKFGALGLGWGFGTFILRAELINPANRLLADDNLTLHCEIKQFTSEESKDPQTIAFPSKMSHLDRVWMANLYKHSRLTDVILVIGDEQREFPAHKLILAAASPVFEEMFNVQMKENLMNRVEILDVKVEVFEQMLQYIYTDKVDNLEMEQSRAVSLLIAADKFQMDSLKEVCEQILSSNLKSIEAIPQLYELATIHNADKLKSALCEFVKKQTEKTMKMIHDQPEVAIKAINILAGLNVREHLKHFKIQDL